MRYYSVPIQKFIIFAPRRNIMKPPKPSVMISLPYPIPDKPKLLHLPISSKLLKLPLPHAIIAYSFTHDYDTYQAKLTAKNAAHVTLREKSKRLSVSKLLKLL